MSININDLIILFKATKTKHILFLFSLLGETDTSPRNRNSYISFQ